MSRTSMSTLVTLIALSLGAVAFNAAPAAATDPLHLLAQVNHQQSQGVVEDTPALDGVDAQSTVAEKRLTLTVDRKAKAAEATSNVAKKLADTQSGIAQNMK